MERNAKGSEENGKECQNGRGWGAEKLDSFNEKANLNNEWSFRHGIPVPMDPLINYFNLFFVLFMEKHLTFAAKSNALHARLELFQQREH